MAKPFIIPFLPQIDAHTPIEILSEKLDVISSNRIDYAPWKDGSSLPDAAFSIAHHGDAIFLKYYITEQQIRATYYAFNDPVYEDSCVEFFISFNDEAGYYNLEFNCTGTARVEFGPSKTERTFISAKHLKAIRYMVNIKNEHEAGVSWELTLMLPKDIFKFHPNLQLEQTPARVNFYKCGDALPEPHFLCWSNIIADKPNFHLPAFFKEAIFKSEEATSNH